MMGIYLLERVQKTLIDDEYTKVYSRFKILLNLDDRDRLIAHGYDDRTPEEITEIYLKELINNFQSDYKLRKIDSLS